MSVDWGYRCLDCGVDSDITLDNAEDELTIIAQQYHHLFAFRAVDSYVITIDLLYHSDILTFLDAHHTHHIAVVNECNEAKPIPRNDTNTIQAAMLAALTTATCEALPDGKFLHTYTAKKTA